MSLFHLQLNVNEEGRSLMGGALAGRNVSPCPGHPCSSGPQAAAAVCGAHGECVAREEAEASRRSHKYMPYLLIAISISPAG